MVPILKNKDLQYCDNWHGISLLDVAEELFARSQNHSREVTEDCISGRMCPQGLLKEINRWGLTVSLSKTKKEWL